MPLPGRRDCDTTICGALGDASAPPELSILAVLSIVIPGVAPAATCTVNTIVALPFAGTLMPVTLSNPVPFAPLPRSSSYSSRQPARSSR